MFADVLKYLRESFALLQVWNSQPFRKTQNIRDDIAGELERGPKLSPRLQSTTPLL